MEFRNLNANEIECRVAQVWEKDGLPTKLSLLLYKTARVDAQILDETVGKENWQCRFYELKNNLYCSVGINFPMQIDGKLVDRWIWKDDCGTESNMEKAKGEASDAFKRACATKWGLGMELYTAPFIYIDATVVYDNKQKLKYWYRNSNGKFATKEQYRVKHIKVVKGEIVELIIYNDTTDKDVYVYGV